MGIRQKFRDLFLAEAWQRQLSDRLSEPLHLHAISAGIALFGGFRAKVAFDLVRRRPFAFAILRAADYAATLGINRLWILEFGTAPGTGLLNMCHIAERVRATTGVSFELVGFDSGSGLPPARDYRDHPERYGEGDFPMDRAALTAALPANARVIYGDIADTVRPFMESLEGTIGFVSVDVDYYWSSVESLKALSGAPDKYLPMTPLYFDDIRHDINNPWCGELLAIAEFNAQHEMRKISPFNFLRHSRIKKKAPWIDQLYVLNVLDHPSRAPGAAGERAANVLPNPLLKP